MQQLIDQVYEKADQYRRGNHSVGMSVWHLQWCTKYRYRMFKQKKYQIICEIVMGEACKRHKIEVIALNTQEEHVHLVASLPRGMTDIRALQLLKGFTAFVLFRLYPWFRKVYPKGNLWSCGNFASTLGFAKLDTIVKYVRDQ
jgi:putative transposase